VTPSAAAHEEDGVDVAVVTHWSSIPAWEAWSTSEVARRLHLPDGTYQYVPNKGEGFPEDFLPFRDLDAAVSAKY
jgi:heme-degrading monooxygenase HmoA